MTETAHCYCQPSITWQRTYDNGNKSDNEGGQICKSSGNFLFVGFTNGTLDFNKYFETISYHIERKNLKYAIVIEKSKSGF